MDSPFIKKSPPVNRLLVFLMLQRTLVNTLHRMVYPFLPFLARAFGVSQAALSGAFSIRSAGAVGGVLLSRYSDSRGRKFGMMMGNGLFVAGIGLIVLLPSFWTFVIGLGISSLGKFVLDSSIQAFVGDEVPVGARGRAFGIVELGWSLSYLVGIWLVRLSMERGGWLAPFPPLGALGLVAMAGLYAWIPAGRGGGNATRPLMQDVRRVLDRPLTRLALVVGLLISAANELVSLVFAAWLEDTLSFSLASLAGAAVFIGAAELIGEGFVGFWMDRLGSIRSVRWGILLNVLFSVLLPFTAVNAAGAYAGLFLFYLSFEFTIVSSLSMLTEIPTKSRATLMAINIAGLSIGRMVSAWVAVPMYGLGFGIVLGAAVLINVGALAALDGLTRGKVD